MSDILTISLLKAAVAECVRKPDFVDGIGCGSPVFIVKVDVNSALQEQPLPATATCITFEEFLEEYGAAVGSAQFKTLLDYMDAHRDCYIVVTLKTTRGVVRARHNRRIEIGGLTRASVAAYNAGAHQH